MTDTLAPHNMINDNIVMAMFVLNIIGISYVFIMNGASILERLKCMFYYESKSTPYNNRTHITWICNTLLYLQTIFYSIIIINKLACYEIYSTDGNIVPIFASCLVLILATLIFKYISYIVVNNILFSKKKALEWNDTYFFTIKIFGFVLAPAAMTILFAPDSFINYVKVYMLFALLSYIYTIFNSLQKIIFNQKGNYLDIFLYLCALEFLPMGIVWKLIGQMSEFLTIKF